MRDIQGNGKDELRNELVPCRNYNKRAVLFGNNLG